jgi:rRNA-processing protein FCF1
MKASSFPRSSVLVLGPNSIQSLVPSTIISQVESLLESHRLEDAYKLADQRRKKLEESINIDEDEVRQLRQFSNTWL